jgi:hypothetical protein
MSLTDRLLAETLVIPEENHTKSAQQQSALSQRNCLGWDGSQPVMTPHPQATKSQMQIALRWVYKT